MKAKVSVVMSVYNSASYLREAIDSILNQTFVNFEFIIVNDGSHDDSETIIRSYNDNRITLLNQQNTGLPSALNYGIERSSTEFIARMDADDIALPDRLELQYEFLIHNTGYVIVGGNAHIIDKDGSYVYTSDLKVDDEEIRKVFPKSPFIHPSVMFRKSAYFKSGKYPEYMFIAQDRVLFNRMAVCGKMANLNNCLIKYRIVPTSNSLKDKKKLKLFESIVVKSINHNCISAKDHAFIHSLISKRDSKERLLQYHTLLAKKYLWNNFKPRLAQENIRRSMKIVPFSKELWVLLLLSYLPQSSIKFIYGMTKLFLQRFRTILYSI